MMLLKDNQEGLNKEHVLLNKKIEESKNELIQLQNNLAFFSNTSADNPVVQEVNSKIELLTNKIENWKTKVNQIKALGRELKKSQEQSLTEELDEE
jgi:predicted  nucleic acid-binding Zn-ribbon protein